jgi:hypothetical protein
VPSHPHPRARSRAVFITLTTENSIARRPPADQERGDVAERGDARKAASVCACVRTGPPSTSRSQRRPRRSARTDLHHEERASGMPARSVALHTSCR